MAETLRTLKMNFEVFAVENTGDTNQMVAMSQAISLKRIANALELCVSSASSAANNLYKIDSSLGALTLKIQEANRKSVLNPLGI